MFTREKMKARNQMSLRLIHSSNVVQQHVPMRTVEQVAEARLPTDTGEFRIIGFRSLTSAEEFVAVVKGELRSDRPSLVRIHSQCMTGNVSRFGEM